jgi:hypothetical protein
VGVFNGAINRLPATGRQETAVRLNVLLRWSPTVIGCLGCVGLIILQAGVRQNRPGCWRVNSKWNPIII